MFYYVSPFCGLSGCGMLMLFLPGIAHVFHSFEGLAGLELEGLMCLHLCVWDSWRLGHFFPQDLGWFCGPAWAISYGVWVWTQKLKWKLPGLSWQRLGIGIALLLHILLVKEVIKSSIETRGIEMDPSLDEKSFKVALERFVGKIITTLCKPSTLSHIPCKVCLITFFNLWVSNISCILMI